MSDRAKTENIVVSEANHILSEASYIYYEIIALSEKKKKLKKKIITL